MTISFLWAILYQAWRLPFTFKIWTQPFISLKTLKSLELTQHKTGFCGESQKSIAQICRALQHLQSMAGVIGIVPCISPWAFGRHGSCCMGLSTSSGITNTSTMHCCSSHGQRFKWNSGSYHFCHGNTPCLNRAGGDHYWIIFGDHLHRKPLAVRQYRACLDILSPHTMSKKEKKKFCRALWIALHLTR